MTSRNLRICLTFLVVAACVGTVWKLIQLKNTNAIGSGNFLTTLAQIGALYTPPITAVGAYWFRHWSPPPIATTTTWAQFLICVVFAVIWLYAPLALLIWGGPIEDVLEVVRQVGWFGQVCNAIFVFSFADERERA